MWWCVQSGDPAAELLWTSQHGDIEAVKLLIKNHQEVINTRDKDKYTPLHRAAYSNHPLIIKVSFFIIYLFFVHVDVRERKTKLVMIWQDIGFLGNMLDIIKPIYCWYDGSFNIYLEGGWSNLIDNST